MHQITELPIRNIDTKALLIQIDLCKRCVCLKVQQANIRNAENMCSTNLQQLATFQDFNISSITSQATDNFLEADCNVNNERKKSNRKCETILNEEWKSLQVICILHMCNCFNTRQKLLLVNEKIKYYTISMKKSCFLALICKLRIRNPFLTEINPC